MTPILARLMLCCNWQDIGLTGTTPDGRDSCLLVARQRTSGAVAGSRAHVSNRDGA